MRATRLNHVSIHAVDMEESLRFYIEVFGMEHVPSPDFEQRVEWLAFGNQQLHLFMHDTPAPEFHHLSLEVDEFEAVYVIVRELGRLDDQTFAPTVRELGDGSVQMYLRDPAGNLVEVDWPDVNSLDRSIVTDIRKLSDERPQSARAQQARLFLKR
ncbi:MAG: VOC family protein [Actinomycetota bacterium]|nr:VOC family protein [Actinomycetota bacterium]